MTIHWSHQAQQQQDQAAEYIYTEFGAKAVIDFYRRIDKIETELMTFTEMGVIEPLLVNRSRLYRSVVVHRLNKLVYTIESDHIQVVALWDTRREPKSLVNDIH